MEGGGFFVIGWIDEYYEFVVFDGEVDVVNSSDVGVVFFGVGFDEIFDGDFGYDEWGVGLWGGDVGKFELYLF